MAKHPDLQHKAQAELDTYIGSRRLLNFGDFEDLVYIRAIDLETLRWGTSVPLGLPHRVMCDDEYHGYFIPKGTVILLVSKLSVQYVALYLFQRFSRTPGTCNLIHCKNFIEQRLI